MKELYVPLTFLFALICNICDAQTINTIAGGYNGDGATAYAIGINPINQVVDKSGNIFITDPDRHLVRKLSVDGTYSTFAGTGISGFNGDGGPADQAELKGPYNIAIDTAGNLFIADSYDNRIRKVAINGTITTLAGNGTLGFSGDGGAATSAQLHGANALAVDIAGNVFIADYGNNRVRKIAANGIITTVAGNGTFGNGGDGGAAIDAQFGNPIGVAVNSTGELFISDLNFNEIRKVSVNGIISTIAGNGTMGGFSGDGGLATSAQLNNVAGSVAIDATGNIFIPDSYNNRIRKVDINGIITTIAGNGVQGFSGDGFMATAAEVNFPTGVSFDQGGNLIISANYRIRKVSTNGIINTVAGNGSGGYSGDNGPATSAELYFPNNVALDQSGNIFVAELQNNRIRKISNNGIITTVAGNGTAGFSGDGGLAGLAQLYSPGTVAVDLAGNIYIGCGDYRIRKVSTNGIISTIAGDGIRSFSGDNGPATSAEFTVIGGISIDAAGNIYIADRYNGRIRKINTEGIVSTVAGNGTFGFSGDGGPATSSQLGVVYNIAVDASGNIYVSDPDNYRVRKVGINGIINTVAGTGVGGFSGDGGPATSATITPTAVATDLAGNIFITDYITPLIRKVNSSGIISTIAGGGNVYGDGGLPTAASLGVITSLAVSGQGNIFLTDFTNHRIREISLSVLPLTLLQFNVRQNGSNILTTWKTANEINTSKFVVQRSLDGHTFTTIGIVRAVVNNMYNKDYGYTDTTIAQLNIKTCFYRLQIIGKDDKKTYSDIIMIVFVNRKFYFALSPNPADKILYVKGDNIKLLSIIDQSGNILKQQRITSDVTAIDISQLPKGIYIVKAYNAKGIFQTKRIVLQ